MMYTLGINAAFHDSAACLVSDGEVLAAAEEERFTHVKHGKRPVPFSAYRLPFHAIDYCLREAGVTIADVRHVAYSYNPYILLGDYTGEETIELPLEPSAHDTPAKWESGWDPLFLSSVVNAPRHLAGGIPHHLSDSLRPAGATPGYRWHFVEHHLCHAASAFLPSPFERAAIMTLDGRGERATTSYMLGEGTRLERLGEVEMPHSLGLVYEEVTEYLGFLRSSDEYKVMALASFGRPAYLGQFLDAVEVLPGGRYRVAPLRLAERFGPPRRKGGPVRREHLDLASSLQIALQEVVLELAGWLRSETGADDLCLAGGVALNCVMNSVLRDSGPFRRVWVQPAAGDAGTALGAALLVDAGERAAASRRYTMEHVFLGPGYGEGEIREFLDWSGLARERLDDVPTAGARLLAEGNILGWFQGRMEFGPRALGARSILASPADPSTQGRLNEIKDREDFRPVAPVVLEEAAGEWFSGAGRSPFMLFVDDVTPARAESIPAVRHVDGTARIQTVNRGQNPLYYDLLKRFEEITGIPVLINTSFNTRGLPIVCSPRDAVSCFWTSPLDALVIGPFLLRKRGRPGR